MEPERWARREVSAAAPVSWGVDAHRWFCTLPARMHEVQTWMREERRRRGRARAGCSVQRRLLRGGVGRLMPKDGFLRRDRYRCHNRVSSLQVACGSTVFDGRGHGEQAKVSILRHDAQRDAGCRRRPASMLAFRDALKSHSRLSTANVYPVPDGTPGPTWRSPWTPWPTSSSPWMRARTWPGVQAIATAPHGARQLGGHPLPAVARHRRAVCCLGSRRAH